MWTSGAFSVAKETLAGVETEVTRAALVLRLAGLALVFYVQGLPEVLGLAAFFIILTETLALLLSPPMRKCLEAHPGLVMLDTLLLALTALASGAESPFVITFMTSALLIGLWTTPVLGLPILLILITAYAAGWGASLVAQQSLALVVPFTFVMLWWLGYAVHQSSEDERRSSRSLRHAVEAAAASEERAHVARELHDTLAKSLQAIHLTATALPAWLDRDPVRGREQVNELRQMSFQAMADARTLMGGLRRTPAGDDFLPMLRDLVRDWRGRVGISVRAFLDEELAITDPLVRYELLMAIGEALENVRRHARASQVTVSAVSEGTHAVIEIADNGVGIEAGRLDEARRDGHFGVQGMRERLTKVGGSLDCVSETGRGTRIILRAPKAGLIEAEGALR